MGNAVFAGTLVKPHTEEVIRDAVSDEDVKEYMEDLRTATSNSKTFIPVRGNGMVCPAEILAQRNNKRINIFLYDKKAGTLKLLKSVGPIGGDIVNILHGGLHFVRLYNPGEHEDHMRSSMQIVKNS